MATILVDYENVDPIRSFMGVNCLQEEDTLYIFYSDYCPTIRADHMAAILDSGCDFRSYKLKNTGSNALDFYISVECGAICERGETNIAVISKDKGFFALKDFFSMKKEASQMQFIQAPSIEAAFGRFKGSEYALRRSVVGANSRQLDIQEQQKYYDERRELCHHIGAAVRGTEYEDRTEDIVKFLGYHQNGTPKLLYSDSLHHFGRNDGLQIYRLVRDVLI